MTSKLEIDNDRISELLDELFASALALTHFLGGIRDEITRNEYTTETAERDLETLNHSEWLNIEAILAELAELNRDVTYYFREGEK